MADFVDYFQSRNAYDVNRRTLVVDTPAQVFALTDTEFTTPLQAYDVENGLPMEVRANADGVYPDFTVPGHTQVFVKSGPYVTVMTTLYGVLKDAGLDPDSIAALLAIPAKSAETLAEAREARDEAVAARVAAEAVGATTDAQMTAVGENAASAFTQQQLASFVSYFRGKFDGTDETTAFQAACTAAAGGTIIIPRGKRLRSQRITVPAAGLSVRLEQGAVIDFIDPGVNNVTCLFRAEDVPFFEYEGGKLEATNATGRTSTHGLIRAKNVGWLRVQHAAFGKSSATAVHTWNVASFVIDDIDIDGTFADGIHLSRATRHGSVTRIRGKNTGDDLVAINSYMPTGSDSFGACEDITIFDIKGENIGNGSQAGRGVAINGGKDVFADKIYIDGVAQAAVIVSRDSGMFDPENVHVGKVIAHNTGLNPPVGGTVGAIFVAHLNGGSIEDPSGTDTRVSIANTVTGDFRFGARPSIWLPASRFVAATGSPTHVATATHRAAVWNMPKGSPTDCSISAVVDVSAEMIGWKTYRVEFLWANGGAGSGTVAWRWMASSYAPGEAIASPATVATVAATAGAQDVVVSSQVATAQAVPAAGRLLTIRPFRVATSGASDTLADTAQLLGVKLTRIS